MSPSFVSKARHRRVLTKREGCHRRELIKDGYFGGQFIVRMKNGKEHGFYYTPFNAEAFWTAVPYFESLKEEDKRDSGRGAAGEGIRIRYMSSYDISYKYPQGFPHNLFPCTYCRYRLQDQNERHRASPRVL